MLNLVSIRRIFQGLSFLRFRPFDSSTLAGRSAERYRRGALTSISSFAARGVGLITGLISVPLTLEYLGTERFGLWATISSVTMMLVFADFGLGNGLINAVSHADGKNSRELAQQAVSSTFFLLLVVALCLSIIFGVVYPFVNWSRVFNVTSLQAIQEAGPAMVAFFLCFVVSLPLGIVQRVQLGYQEGFLSSIWQIVGNVLGLCCVVLAIKLRAGLLWLVLAMSGAPTIVLAINWFAHFGYQRPWLWPHLTDFSWTNGRALLGTGLVFMLLTIVNILGTSTDNIIIAQYLGASKVSTYAVLQRLLSITLIVQYFISPLWPAFNEALARGEHAWARKTLSHSLVLSFGASTAICFLMLVFGRDIIRVWAGEAVLPTWSLLVGYTMFRLVSGFAEGSMPLMQTGQFVRRLLVFASVAGIVTFVLKILFVPIWQMAGVAWANALGYGLFFTVPITLIAYRGLRKGEELESDSASR